MADITQDTFDEDNLRTKVVFQKARDVPDFELNELQDLLRIANYRWGLHNGGTGLGIHDAASLKVTGTGANNDVTVASGAIFVDGYYIPVTGGLLSTLGATLVTSGSDQYDYVYLEITEAEVDSAVDATMAVAALGETAIRRRLTVTFKVSAGSTPPASSGTLLSAGGTKRYPLAKIFRDNGVAAIGADDVQDIRTLTGPAFSTAMDNVTFRLKDSGDVSWTESTSTLLIRDGSAPSNLDRGLEIGLDDGIAVINGSWTLSDGQVLRWKPKFFHTSGDLHVPGVAVGVATDGQDDDEIAVVNDDALVEGDLVIAVRRGADIILNKGTTLIGNGASGDSVDHWNKPGVLQDIEGFFDLATDDFVYPTTELRTVHISPLAGADRSALGHGWTTIALVEATSQVNAARMCFDLKQYLPSGASIQEFDIMVQPGTTRATVGNRFTATLIRNGPDWDDGGSHATPLNNGSATYTTALDSQTDDGMNTLQVIELTYATALDFSTYSYMLILQAGNDAGSNNDDVWSIRIKFNDPGPRNF